MFRPINPKKYLGDARKIVWRSTWEYRFMRRLDSSPSVVGWLSEGIVVPYLDKTTGRLRRYFPDFLCKKANGETLLIEIKPAKESPRHSRLVGGKKTDKQFIAEALVWSKNQSKFEAAERYCAQKGWKFVVLTERELGV
jgi:Straboviridae/Kyanoviridae head completion nuclease